jgi:toxin ParE1/3/4
MNVRLHTEAGAELDGAAAKYDSERRGLGDEFLAEVERVVELLRQFPKIGGIYPGDTLRHFTLHRFPYVLLYGIFSDTIWIMAVAHGSRQPLYWRGRLPEEP